MTCDAKHHPSRRCPNLRIASYEISEDCRSKDPISNGSEGVGCLGDLDDDIGGARQLERPRVERDLDGVEDVEIVQPHSRDTGGAEQLGDLCLDEIVLRPGVSLDDHDVDADVHRVR
ncbi:hypothetical protein ZEAMMB73_Zm00001d021361 [Zea mays]|uniref:Uncharacterized protein n=1 Tax=Zea mays TaxID=4577 RepID=A0A1D6IAF3_MAIZE|nr:hypothetical protein ZEAMMB73_Zm00001d021361 [Zea mays]